MKEFELPYGIKHTPSHEELVAAAARALGTSKEQIASVRILRRSLDARGEIIYRYRVEALCKGEQMEEPYTLPEYKDVEHAEPVIIVGSGPAGMFAALRLLMEGRKPVILERGKDVHARKYDIAALTQKQQVNPDSNYCYGEGGAGTFSDGKLFTRSNKRGDIREVLYQLVAFGADPSILIDAHPHIGSDRLPSIVENIRKCIIEHGGEYHFNSKVTDLLQISDGSKKQWKVVCEGGECFSAENVIVATGHSAKDIYELFARKGWPLQMKGFALGVRAEHPQSLINKIQYHGKYQPY
ncbi:MAG: FAD-binding protein, partial [Bacteroidales bacterium]|nr:FAD-binding protein [Bacteroidales bacterium]